MSAQVQNAFSESDNISIAAQRTRLIRRGEPKILEELYEMQNRFERLARDLMNKHGLTGWRLDDLGDDCDLSGCCRPSQSTIALAFDKASKKSLAWQRDLILHEVAHALAPPDSDHGESWATIAESIGVRRLSVLIDLFLAAMRADRDQNPAERKKAAMAFQKRVGNLSVATFCTLVKRARYGDSGHKSLTK